MYPLLITFWNDYKAEDVSHFGNTSTKNKIKYKQTKKLKQQQMDKQTFAASCI